MLTLAEAKLHVRVDHDDEDAAIETMIGAASAAILNYLDLDAQPDPLPDPVKQACLMLVCDLYENRAATTDAHSYVNATYQALLNPYRVMAV